MDLKRPIMIGVFYFTAQFQISRYSFIGHLLNAISYWFIGHLLNAISYSFIGRLLNAISGLCLKHIGDNFSSHFFG